MRRAGTHLLVAFLVSSLVRAPAWGRAPIVPVSPASYAGKTTQKLVIVIAGLDPKAKAQLGVLEQAAEATADAASRYDVLRGIDAFDPRAQRTRFVRRGDADSLMRDGHKALDDLDSVKATQLFTDSMAAWRQSDLTDGIDTLVEAWAGKAASHAVSGENPQAKAEIEKVLVVSTKAKFSEAHFTPELLKYAEAQRKAVANAKGKMVVRTEPAGARVWVDGAYRGVSPATIEGVAAGKHVIVTGMTGYSLTVSDGSPGEELVKLKPAELAVQLQSAIDRIAKDPEGPGRDAAARDVGTATKAEQVLLVVAKKSPTGDKLDVTGLRIDVKDGHNLAFGQGTISTAPGDLRGLEGWLTSLLTKDELRAEGKIVTHFTDAAASGGKLPLRKVLGFGLMGAGVLFGALWGVFGFSALSQSAQYRNTLQVEGTKSAQLSGSGRAFSVIADVSWLLGLLLVAGGGVLVFTNLFGGAAASGEGARPTDDRRAAEEAQARADEDAKRKAAEEARRKEEEDARRKAEAESKRQGEEEQKKKAEEEKKKAVKGEEDKRTADEEKKKKADDEKKKKADDEERRREEQKQKTAEEERKKAEEDERRREEKKKKRADDKDKKKQPDEKKPDEEDLRNF